jgi:hypothetical protein
MKRLLLGASVLVLGLSACGGSHRAISGGRVTAAVPPSPLAVKVAARRELGTLAVTVPRVLRRYNIRGGGHMVGIRAPVIGVLATDDPGAHYGGGGFAKWSDVSSDGPPPSRVAFAIHRWVVIGPDLPPSAVRLHLPLSLHQPWFREHLRNGHLGYQWGYLRVHGLLYAALFWSGRDAPAHDRAAVLTALASVHPAQ